MTDPAQFDQMVAQFYGQLYRAALVMTGCASDAEDLVQETFLQAIANYGKYSGRSQVQTWLYGILLNQNHRHQRHRSRRWRRWLVWFQRKAASTAPDGPDQDLMRRQWQHSLWAQVAELPVAQRDALVLRFAQGLSYEEIASVLDCPVGTVRSRLHYGLIALRKRLAEFGPDDVCTGKEDTCRAQPPLPHGGDQIMLNSYSGTQ